MIAWTENGNSFAIVNVDEFGKLLCRYFKINNFASFVRQLNMYSFRKVKNGGWPQEFSHPHFKREAFDELGLIQRKKVSQKGARSLRYDTTRETNQRLEALQQKLEDMLDQNRLLITTNKRFMAKLNAKNKDYAVKEQKMLYLCGALSLKLIKPEPLRETLKQNGIRVPDYDTEVFEGVAHCFRREVDTEHGDVNFVDNLVHTSLGQLASDSLCSKSTAFRIKSILEKNSYESDVPQNVLVPKTAFAFRFPKKRSVSIRSELSESFRDAHKAHDAQNGVHISIKKKINSPVYSDCRMASSSDDCDTPKHNAHDQIVIEYNCSK